MSLYSQPKDYQWPGFSPKLFEFGRIGSAEREFFWPWLLDVSISGDIAIADTDNCRIQVFDANQLCCPLYAPFGERGCGENQLLYPRSVKFYSPLPMIQMAIADTGNRRVVLVGPKQNYVGKPLCTVFSFGETMFREPSDIAANSHNGFMYVTDASLGKVTIHDRDGRFLGECRIPSEFSLLHRPVGVTMDGRGRVLVTDMGKHNVRAFDANGQYICTLGAPGPCYGEFSSPKGICSDQRGYIYVADEGNNRIQQFSPDMRFLSEVVHDIPLPKGVAVHKNLYTTTADQCNFIKLFNT